MFNEEIFAYANQFSYASNFVPGDSRYLIEIALLQCIGETRLLHLCSPHRDHCYLESYSYAGHIAAWYAGNIKRISGSLRSDFRRKHNCGIDFVGRTGWRLITDDATVLSTFWGRGLSNEGQ